ncbi:MAG: T9SS type A sorting domain-containing protein [Ignavibacteria bacterium]|nr:T9SS type A sorting domain-containing protein [Ignavibacteria bacterium]
MENKEVTFKVNGANPDTVIILTNNTGIAKFCYFGINPGNDTITAIAGGLQNQARVFWDFPTPVELSAFTSSVLGRNVTLNWSTSSEFNNSDFDIERSSTENNWIKAGFIRGHGTISEPQNYSFTDKNLTTGKYKYRLKQIDFNGNFEYFELAEEVSIGIPDKYELSQNYPNPFNPVTNLEFGISKLGFVSLKIYDVLGRELVTLVNEIKEPGYYKIKFNAGNLSSGVYFYRMEAGDFVTVKKFVVMK